MTILYINTGSSPNSGDGDSLRTAFNKINQNISYLAAATGDITFDGVKIIGAGTASGDGNGYSTIELVPDASLTSTDQYLVIDPTAPNHIHIRAGGQQNESTAELYLGGENSYVRVIDNGGVRINQGQFNNTLTYFESTTDYDLAAWYTDEGGNHWIDIFISDPLNPTRDPNIIGTPSYNFPQYSQNRIEIFDGSGSHVLSPAGETTVVGNPYQIRLDVNEAPPISPTIIVHMTYRFYDLNQSSLLLEDNDFDLQAANAAYIFAGQTIDLATGVGNLRITTNNNSSSSQTWYFNTDGSFTFPDGSVQTTAATGSGSTGTLTVSGHIIPTANLTYDLGSTSSQWRSLHVGTSTIYLGGVALSVDPAGSLTVNGDTVQGLPTITVPASTGTTYKGLQVSYGMVHSNGSSNELNVNKIVIHKPALTITTIDPTSSQDDFQVSGLGDSDVLAMFVLYGDVNGPKALSTLTTFAEAAIDNVVLDGGVEGDYNTVEQMKTAFYTNYSTLAASAGGLDQDFNFFSGDISTTTGTTTVRQGSGAVFDITNLGNGTYYASGIQNNGTNYLAGHKIKILGTSLTGTVNTTTYIAGTDYAPLDVIRGGDAISVSTTQTAIIAALSTGTVLTNIDGLGETLTITGSGVEYTEYTGFLIYPTTGTVTVSIGTGLGEFTIDGFTYTGATPDNDCIITVDSISEGGLIFQWSVAGVAAGTEEVFHGAITGTNYQTGSDFSVGSINPNDRVVSITNAGSNYVADDQVTLPGSDLLNGTSPDNDVVIRILTVDGNGTALTWEYLSGTIPQGTWPSNNIGDGGNDQYDTANYINSSLASQIDYNSGGTVADGTAAFGTGSSYTFVYDTGIFGLLVTGNQSTSISTSGNSGADGNSTTEAGNLYGPDTPSATYDNAVTHINFVSNLYAGPLVSFTKTDNGDEVDDLIADDGDGAGVGITRNNNQGIYNPYREGGWASDVSPDGTLWNIDGWADFSDVESRTYQPLYAAFGFGGLGNKIVGAECVMYLPDNGKYYTVKFNAWTQNNNGGGFAYTRRELNLTSLSEGIRFPDGTRLTSAEGVGRVKSTAPGNRRIEEVSGYNQVSVTARTTSADIPATVYGTAAENLNWYVDIVWDAALDVYAQGTTPYSLSVSTDAGENWYPAYLGGYNTGVSQQIVVTGGASVLQASADSVIDYRIITGADPVIWWDKADLPGGGTNFRGAVIDYHAYTDESTIIGTIHIVDDDGEEHISHQEVQSGSTDGDNDDLWLVQNEGTVSYRRIDGESKTLKIHWTAKVFYGSETYN